MMFCSRHSSYSMDSCESCDHERDSERLAKLERLLRHAYYDSGARLDRDWKGEVEELLWPLTPVDPPAEPARFFLAQDNSCHWYLVPVARYDEWERWNNLDEDDQAGWDAPEWAQRLNGGVSRVTFTDPRDGAE